MNLAKLAKSRQGLRVKKVGRKKAVAVEHKGLEGERDHGRAEKKKK